MQSEAGPEAVWRDLGRGGGREHAHLAIRIRQEP
ncbi:hypothetical protein E2C01_063037 [Portunus trituberculatus]|uniref:Uncharacterized protein n=1 Tax=Portunus trituberculatus TaxID=210409 RepID=A0A5B7HHP6_PORTR|nr:hypothetical protein [Portunus trituberculatus]